MRDRLVFATVAPHISTVALHLEELKLDYPVISLNELPTDRPFYFDMETGLFDFEFRKKIDIPVFPIFGLHNTFDEDYLNYMPQERSLYGFPKNRNKRNKRDLTEKEFAHRKKKRKQSAKDRHKNNKRI